MSDLDAYMDAQRRRLIAEGRPYKAQHIVRIPLRACYWQCDDTEGCSGVALPDGRLIFAESTGIATYSSEAALQKQHPGAVLHWALSADATVNHVMESSDAFHR